MKENLNWKKFLKEALDKTQFMALGTKGSNGVWVCPVYFAFDDKYRLYFISQMQSQHMQNIEKDNSVSVAIFSTEQEPKSDVIGIQLEGKVEMVNEAEAEEACKIYFTATGSRRPVKADNPPMSYVGTEANWRLVKIVPTKVFYFDTKVFGEKRVEVPKEYF